MTQDTRKDRRVKIVSLNVRYKSATVDEFIENHAHDVSRGGIYIKTGSPFPPGTLLKFEVRLASDQAVISGVGRVVWKRETSQGTAERPAGMGVKFIKIDDSSKTVIDKLVNTRADAGKTYEAEVEGPGKVSERPPPVVPAPRPPLSKTPPPVAAAPRPGKSTMVGLGAVQLPAASAPRPAASAAPPRVSAAPDMFPKQSPSNRPAEEAKAEPTVMKQAAELLEEALREAGGSMAEVGTNPLFAGTDTPAPKAPTPAAGAPPTTAADEVTIHKLLSPVPEAPTPAPPDVDDDAVKARAMAAGLSPGGKGKDSADATGPQRVSRPPSLRPQRTSSRPSSVPPAPVAKKSGRGGLIFVGLLVAVAAVTFVFRAKLFGGDIAPEPPPPPTATASAPSASASAAASAAPEPSASAAQAAPSASAAAATSAATATASASASAAPPKPGPAQAGPAPKPAAASPAAAPAKPAAPVATAPPAEAPAATTTAAATATAAPAPTATATATAAPAAAPAPKPAPAPAKPKPAAKPADDNPY
jgi:uncharacterized protein (TIGR02266 family)